VIFAIGVGFGSSRQGRPSRAGAAVGEVVMWRNRIACILVGVLVVAVAVVGPTQEADAVPSFARQTDLPCSACHTVFPQLTEFGRNFKMEGYTQIASTSGETKRLQEGAHPPIALMLMTSLTSTSEAQPGTQNGNVLLPDQMSLFYAGRISGHLGAFIQFTYDGVGDHFSMDNTDVRYGHRRGEHLLYGLTLNNNPTVEDVWNSTPAWGYPYAASGVAPAPAAATLIDGTLAQQVAGLGAFASYDTSYYGLITLYRSSQIGGNEPPDDSSEDIIDGVMPYWRLAYSRPIGSGWLEVGTYGLHARLYPGGGVPLSGETDRLLDLALDAQYQWLPGGPHTLTLHSTWIREKQQWDASYPLGLAARHSDLLRTFRVDGTYYYDRKVGGTLAYFSATGNRDMGLYGPDPIDGSRIGSPDSKGFIIELDYVPWYNTKLLAQYTVYNTFNGSSSNYDGYGRSASDNNTLYLNVWIAF
jgi:hypothetical protein